MVDPRGFFAVQAGELSEPDSATSYLIQAADYAAGIARDAWVRHGLPHLVDTFTHVTYNGRRIGPTDAVTIAADLSKRGHQALPTTDHPSHTPEPNEGRGLRPEGRVVVQSLRYGGAFWGRRKRTGGLGCDH